MIYCINEAVPLYLPSLGYWFLADEWVYDSQTMEKQTAINSKKYIPSWFMELFQRKNHTPFRRLYLVFVQTHNQLESRVSGTAFWTTKTMLCLNEFTKIGENRGYFVKLDRRTFPEFNWGEIIIRQLHITGIKPQSQRWKTHVLTTVFGRVKLEALFSHVTEVKL